MGMNEGGIVPQGACERRFPPLTPHCGLGPSNLKFVPLNPRDQVEWQQGLNEEIKNYETHDTGDLRSPVDGIDILRCDTGCKPSQCIADSEYIGDSTESRIAHSGYRHNSGS